MLVCRQISYYFCIFTDSNIVTTNLDSFVMVTSEELYRNKKIQTSQIKHLAFNPKSFEFSSQIYEDIFCFGVELFFQGKCSDKLSYEVYSKTFIDPTITYCPPEMYVFETQSTC